MGIMICPKHGRSEFIEGCSHVSGQIAAGNSPKGRRFDILGHLFICDACFESLGFNKCIGLADAAGPSFEADDPRWAAYDAAYGAIEYRDGHCSKCINELESAGSAR